MLSYEELLRTRDRLLERHRGTIFIACHLSNQGNDLAALAKALDRYPKLFLDISARDYEVGRQPRAAAKFLARYRDRVLFGTDMERAPEMYRLWWRLLETADEYIPGPHLVAVLRAGVARAGARKPLSHQRSAHPELGALGCRGGCWCGRGKLNPRPHDQDKFIQVSELV